MKIFMRIVSILLFIIITLPCVGNDDKEIPKKPKGGFDIGISDMSARDPFIFADPKTKMYYLAVNGGTNVKMYASKDLKK